MTEALHTRYRPRHFEEVVGQAPVLKALRPLIKNHSSQAFIFCGPTGTGKTTLARITAREMGTLDRDVLEIDAATYTGIDSIRELQRTTDYVPLGEGKYKSIIMDESHALSRQAWQSLLKIVEEPPAHLIWFFCTTEPEKIPPTIKTRCTMFTLQPVSKDNLHKLVDEICHEEKITLAEGVATVLVREANGSPRQALVNLELCRTAKDRVQAAAILQTASENDATLELCRFVVDGRGSWGKAMKILEKLEGDSPETIRIQVCNYLAVALRNAQKEQEAVHLLNMLDCFSRPFNASERLAPLYLAIGRVLYPNS